MKRISLNFTKILIFTILTSLFTFSCGQSTPSFRHVDLTYAAEKSVHAVVHIQTEFMRKSSLWDYFFGDDWLSDFFGLPRSSSYYPVVAAGSGVIISEDGYIITNYHVVSDAEKITVTLNNQSSYEGYIVEVNPEVDLALIKIDTQHLNYLTFGNSDDVKLGEWVLAVGNPFNLTSTVTAGIVSAKARDLNILGSNSSNSYIQTDAAVNKGNSGGALVNAKGELIGINTAIASGNGYYTGYSFAIPSNIAKEALNKIKR